MDLDGGYRHGGGGANGRYGSFKSLLLDDGEVVEEGGMGGPSIFSGTMEVDDALYRDEVASGRESFQSLLLEGGVEEDEVQFSPRYYKSVGSGNLSLLASATKCSENGDSLDDQEGLSKEAENLEESITLPRRRRRENSCKSAARLQNNHSLDLVPYKDSIVDNGEQHQQLQSLRSLPSSKKKKLSSQLLKVLPPTRKKKQGSSIEVQKLLDSVIERQERFFADLLESMERKEEIRERIREEKEDKWRAEERAQLCLFNNAMIALTQELTGELLCNGGRQVKDRCRRDH